MNEQSGYVGQSVKVRSDERAGVITEELMVVGGHRRFRVEFRYENARSGQSEESGVYSEDALEFLEDD